MKINLVVCKRCKKEKVGYAKGFCKSCYTLDKRDKDIKKGICGYCGRNPIDYSRSNASCTACLDRIKIRGKEYTDQIRDIDKSKTVIIIDTDSIEGKSLINIALKLGFHKAKIKQ